MARSLGLITSFLGNLVSTIIGRRGITLSVETEFRAMTSGVCELLWVKIILKDLKVQWSKPMKLYCDHKSTINIAHNPM